MPNLTELVSFSAILQLPWAVWLPGLILSLLFVMAGFRSLLSLRLAKAFSRLILSFVVLVILSQGGSAVAQLLGLEIERPAESTITDASGG